MNQNAMLSTHPVLLRVLQVQRISIFLFHSHSVSLTLCSLSLFRMEQLSLPETDAILPSAHEGLPFSAENPWFDFRDAIIPWDEYKELGADKRVCRPETVETRREVAHYGEYDNGLVPTNGSGVRDMSC